MTSAAREKISAGLADALAIARGEAEPARILTPQAALHRVFCQRRSEAIKALTDWFDTDPPLEHVKQEVAATLTLFRDIERLRNPK